MSDSIDTPSGEGSKPVSAQWVSDQPISGQQVLLIFLLSGWLTVSLFVWFSAGVTFEVLSIKKTPEISNRFTEIPEVRRERLLRQTAGAINRKMFGGWNVAQLIGGLIILGLFFRVLPETGQSPQVHKYMAIAAFSIVLAHALFLGPGIAQSGSLLDAPDPVIAAQAARQFGIYHGVYMSSDLLKVVLVGWLLWIVFRRLRPTPGVK